MFNIMNKLISNGEKLADIGNLTMMIVKERKLKPSMLIALTMVSYQTMAQEINLDKIESESQRGIKLVYKIAQWVIAVALIVGLISVVYMVVTNNPRSKEAVIGFIAALILVGIAYVVIPKPE